MNIWKMWGCSIYPEQKYLKNESFFFVEGGVERNWNREGWSKGKVSRESGMVRRGKKMEGKLICAKNWAFESSRVLTEIVK